MAEATAADTNIGGPVAATDADDDELTYTLGGSDAASFDFDSSTGQLKTKAKLDRELKDRYTVDLSVNDGRGGRDAIRVFINVTDITEVPVTNPDTETVALVDPEEEIRGADAGRNGNGHHPGGIAARAVLHQH